MTSWIDLAGWTLVHFVWQGALLALATAATLRLLGSSTARLRYVVSCAALAAMLAAPIATALVLSGAPRSALLDSVHVLRSPQGRVLGVVVGNPWSPARSSSQPVQPPAELRLPVEINTDTLFSAIVTLWLVGVAVLLGRLGVGCWRVRGLQLAAQLEEPSRWQTLAEELARRLGLRRRFLVVGWLRPMVLLPVAAMSGLSPRQVEAILAHELAHIRRHDFLVNLLQTLAETVLFYHPAVWWISRRIRTEREHCCDDVAVSVCGDATEYAAALTELASWSIAHSPLAMAATRGPLLGRVRRLLRLPESDQRTGRTTLVAGVLFTCLAVVVLGTLLRAQPVGPNGVRGFGPPDVNRLLGFNLFPAPVQLPTDDPIGARAWSVTVGSGSPTVPADVTIVEGRPDGEQVRTALQQYFEGTLGLTTHRESRTFPAYALVLANADGRLGSSLKPSTIDCIGSGGPVRPNRNVAEVGPVLHERSLMHRVCGVDDNFFGLTGARVTMAQLAREFHRPGYPLAPDREVVDRTGLDGTYDFDLRFGLLPLAAIGHANYRIERLLEPFGIRSVFTALPEQLGLKLVDTTVSREVLVIDQINRPQ
jgi:uncharacterized protein (TIGR03435 family)